MSFFGVLGGVTSTEHRWQVPFLSYRNRKNTNIQEVVTFFHGQLLSINKIFHRLSTAEVSHLKTLFRNVWNVVAPPPPFCSALPPLVMPLHPFLSRSGAPGIIFPVGDGEQQATSTRGNFMADRGGRGDSPPPSNSNPPPAPSWKAQRVDMIDKWRGSTVLLWFQWRLKYGKYRCAHLPHPQFPIVVNVQTALGSRAVRHSLCSFPDKTCYPPLSNRVCKGSNRVIYPFKSPPW